MRGTAPLHNAPGTNPQQPQQPQARTLALARTRARTSEVGMPPPGDSRMLQPLRRKARLDQLAASSAGWSRSGRTGEGVGLGRAQREQVRVQLTLVGPSGFVAVEELSRQCADRRAAERPRVATCIWQTTCDGHLAGDMQRTRGRQRAMEAPDAAEGMRTRIVQQWFGCGAVAGDMGATWVACRMGAMCSVPCVASHAVRYAPDCCIGVRRTLSGRW